MSEAVKSMLLKSYNEKTVNEAYAYADRILFGTGKDDDSVPNEDAFKDILASAFLSGVKYTRIKMLESVGV